MASISSSTSLIAHATLVNKRVAISSSPILGLPSMTKKGKISCNMEVKPTKKESTTNMGPGLGSGLGLGSSLMAAAVAATVSNPAMALVDERMSTEGTGLPFGLSNNILGWILLGVFGLIWALYFTYTSGLDEDEESGLSL